jgi:hypothetical protein
VPEADGEVVGTIAYQWIDGEGEVLLSYECDALFGLESFYVQTEDRWDNTAGYAPDMSTTFTVDGTPYPTDKSYSFSAEGISEAMRQASEPCF